MDDATFQYHVERLQEIIRRWLPRSQLTTWDIAFRYEREDLADSPCRMSDTGEGTVATCRALWEYMTAEIVFSIKRVARLSDRRLELVVLHELGHIILSGMRPANPGRAWTIQEERTASIIAFLIYQLGSTKPANVNGESDGC